MEAEEKEHAVYPPSRLQFRGGEARRPDVKQPEGHQRRSDRWSENHRPLQLKRTSLINK